MQRTIERKDGASSAFLSHRRNGATGHIIDKVSLSHLGGVGDVTVLAHGDYYLPSRWLEEGQGETALCD
jgi:hypothetical protein